jgi:lipopolysaccharide transport system permease protein
MSQVVLRTSRPEPISALLSPGGMAANLWKHRDLTLQFAVRYFQARYRGTYLGVFWALVFPLVLLGVYTFVFQYIFTARSALLPEESRFQFAVWLFCGMVVFAVFSETVVRSCSLVLENPNYVTKVVFPLEILPVAALGSSVMFSGFGIALVLAGTLAAYGTLPWTALLLPMVLLPLLALSLGLSWFLASLGVFVRDVGNIVTIVVAQLLLFLTPIFYRIEDMKEWKWLADINPLAVVIHSARECTIYGRVPDWADLAGVLVIGLLTMQLGYAWFMKSKRGFADVL